jgi:Rhodanese-like domain
MNSRGPILRVVIFLAILTPTVQIAPRSAQADPSKYPEFAQQTLPDNIIPVFIHIEELVAELKTGAKPLIIDVRSDEEFREVHILGAVSAPLAEFKDYLKSIPRDRPVVLY